MSKTSYEGQIEPRGGGFYLTVTISAQGHYWTTQPVRLAAKTAEEANVEADQKMRAAAAAFSGEADTKLWGMPRRIDSRAALAELARELGVRQDWHEPDERGVTASTHGTVFDTAGFWGKVDAAEWNLKYGNTDGIEQWVTLYQEGMPVAEVNLATLFAWATGYESPSVFTTAELAAISAALGAYRSDYEGTSQFSVHAEAVARLQAKLS